MKFTKNFLKNIFEKILFSIIPSQNPDLDKNFEKIAYWLIEFENEIPIREMAFDSENRRIAKMSDDKNFGFWTDDEMHEADFLKNFKYEKISENFFGEKWKNNL